MKDIADKDISGKTLHRNNTNIVDVGGIKIGGGNPVVVQSMSNTDTADVEATIHQVKQLWEAGSEIVRITVNNEAAAEAVAEIKSRLPHVPLVGCFHYNGHTLLEKYPNCAKALDKIRINPGNVGFGKKKDQQFLSIIEIAIHYNKAIRLGGNWGSLDQVMLAKVIDEELGKKNIREITCDALIRSTLSSAELAVKAGLGEDKIVISCKVSNPQDLFYVYRKLAKQTNFPLHLGLTEAGIGMRGIAHTASALSVLLEEGIGDTIRSSLTPEPNGDRTLEVRLCQEILQALELRSFFPQVIACPGCGRTTNTLFQEIALKTNDFIKQNIAQWRVKHPKVVDLRIAVMGCIVNGPGESKHANIGISLPGTGENPTVPIFIDGKKVKTLHGDYIPQFHQIIKEYIEAWC